MATVTKTWSFPTDTMGLTGQGSASITYGWVNDGNPAGCIKFSATTKSLNNASMLVTGTGSTWEGWGVPAGATVTGLTLTGWKKRLAAATNFSAATLRVQVQSAGVTVTSAGDVLVATLATTPVSATWSAGAAGSLLAVDSAYQASTTTVNIALSYVMSTTSGQGTSVDYRFDEIALQMTYTPPAGGGGAAAANPAALLMAM